jgi:hypothetical protein
MHNKDYVAIAKAIHEGGYIPPLWAIEAHAGGKRMRQEISSAIADYCEQDSPRFDRARFLKACGVSE